jgi:hypothetical protein
MPIGFLLALQASGMVIDYLNKQDQIRQSQLGAQVEQAGIASDIAASRLSTEEESLQSMKQLRQNLGTQAAVMAARGSQSGQGSNVFFTNDSIANFNANERIRKINQSGTEAALKANQTLSKLHESSFENNTMGDFAKNTFNKIPTSPTAWEKIGQGFSASKGYGFGLTKVGV